MATRRPHPDDPLTRWLDAEREVDDAGAEAALLALFESLPRLAPSAGFADRVLEQIALPAPVPVRQGWFHVLLSPALRLALASGLLAACISLLWLPQTVMALAGMVTMADVVQLGVASLVDLGRWLVVAAGVGEWFLTVLGALAVSLTSPAALRVTVACLVISATAFAFLRDLITRDRSLSYADSRR